MKTSFSYQQKKNQFPFSLLGPLSCHCLWFFFWYLFALKIEASINPRPKICFDFPFTSKLFAFMINYEIPLRFYISLRKKKRKKFFIVRFWVGKHFHREGCLRVFWGFCSSMTNFYLNLELRKFLWKCDGNFKKKFLCIFKHKLDNFMIGLHVNQSKMIQISFKLLKRLFACTEPNLISIYLRKPFPQTFQIMLQQFENFHTLLII